MAKLNSKILQSDRKRISMKQIFKSILTAVFFLQIVTISAQAQFEKPEIEDLKNKEMTPLTNRDILPWLHLGVYGGYNHNIHTADFQTLPGFGTCSPGYKEGGGKGYFGGIMADYAISDLIGIEARLGYIMLDGELTRRGLIGNIQDVKNPDAVTEIFTDHVLKATLPAIVFEPMLNIRPVPRLSIRAGGSFASLLKSTFEYNEAIAEPDNLVFLNGEATRNQQSGEIPEKKSLMMGVTAGAGYDFPVGKSIFVMPEARYTLYFTDISSVNWKVSSFQIGAALKYAFYPKPEGRIYRDTVYMRDTTVNAVVGIPAERNTRTSVSETTEDHYEENDLYSRTTITEHYLREIPKTAAFSVNITATGIAPDGTRQSEPLIVVEETEWEELFPLLPYVFFKEGKSDIGEVRQNLLKETETAGFSEQKLPLATLGVYAELLNIIGSRMQENPKAKITLVGTNSNTGIEAKNTKLSKDRADAVKEYLTKVWKIGGDRISIEPRNLPQAPSNIAKEDGQVENRRVEIKSATYDIIKPVRKQEIIRSATPPLIELAQQATSEMGLKTWEVRVEQGGQTLRSFKNDIPSVPQLLRWRIDEAPVPQLEEPITISLRATDAAGETKIAETVLKVQQLTIKKKRFEKINDKRVERYSLILFEFDKAELGPENMKIAEEIKKRIGPTSTITIAGYADRMGESEYNRQLAKRRCESTQKALGLSDDRVVLKPVGSDTLLFDNDIPEGRSYCRTVQIIVETPVTE
ncbi:MAG: OmpA family protein [Bacteroidota bacterium]